MTTTVTTTNPVRSDVLDSHAEAGSRRTSRGWAFAGIGAAVAGIATIALSSSIDVVYRSEFEGTTHGVASALQDKAPVMFAFHISYSRLLGASITSRWQSPPPVHA